MGDVSMCPAVCDMRPLETDEAAGTGVMMHPHRPSQSRHQIHGHSRWAVPLTAQTSALAFLSVVGLFIIGHPKGDRKVTKDDWAVCGMKTGRTSHYSLRK